MICKAEQVTLANAEFPSIHFSYGVIYVTAKWKRFDDKNYTSAQLVGMKVRLHVYLLSPQLTPVLPSHFLTFTVCSVSSIQVYETPFFVAVDHAKKKVVISIRGTLSPKVNFSFCVLF